MTEQTFFVQQDTFEGPLDLLLNLIEKRKLHISDISLSQVADDFISHIKQFEHMPVADSAQFILVASTLTLIKSKALLPMLDLTTEEEADISDLETRLKQYKRMKDLSVSIGSMYLTHPMHTSRKQMTIDPVFSPTTEGKPEEDITVPRIQASIHAVLSQLPQAEKMAKAVVDKVVSLEEMIDKLTSRVVGSLKMSFSEFSGKKQGGYTKEEKVHVVVSFLAMLELVKNGVIMVTQGRQFDDIEMETHNIGLPKY